MPPTIPPGKISYIQIPALDVDRSVVFYETVFGWNIRRRRDGEVAFDDTAGEVSGTWVTGRPPAAEPGLLVYVMVESVEQTLNRIREAGGGRDARHSAGRGRSVRDVPRPGRECSGDRPAALASTDYRSSSCSS